jgi:hypothetical protein
MGTREDTNAVNKARRRLLSATAAYIAALTVAGTPFPLRQAAATDNTIRPFRIDVPEEQLPAAALLRGGSRGL